MSGKSVGGMETNGKGVPVNWNGEHWDFYKAMMVSVFEEDDLEAIADGTRKPPVVGKAGEDDLPEWKQDQAKIKRLILGSVSLALAQRVMRKATGTEMWRTLVELFEAPTNQTLLVHKQRQLVSELWHTRAKKDDDMLLHLGKLYDIRDRLTTLQYAVHDVDMVDAMLNSLPRHWKYQHLNQMVTLNPGANYTVDTVRDLILVAASQLKDESGDLNGGRTHSGNRGEAKNGKAGNQKGDKKEDQSKRPTESRKCFLCNKKGQIKKNCPDKETTSETTSADAMANSAEVPKDTKKKKEANGALLAKTAGCVQSVQVPAMMTPDVSLNGSSDGETGNHGAENADYNPSRWIYDTGASTHVVGSMNYFVAFQSFDENVEDVHGFARGVQPGARGIGSIALTTDVGDGLLRTFFLEDVMFVPEANWNLFSVGLARKQGFVEEKNEATGECQLYRHGRLVLRSDLASNGVWAFTAKNGWIMSTPADSDVNHEVNFTNADGVASIRTWHARLGHTCAQHLKVMMDKELVRGMMLRGRELPPCGACELTKQKRTKHAKKFERGIQEPNEVIFVDLMDPGRNNHTRFSQVLVVVDGLSRWMSVYMLTSKTEANKYIKEYVAWAERQLSRSVKCVVSDGGSEFVNGEMKAWYHEQGIQLVTLAPGGSSVNYSERAIQTLRNTMKAMLGHSGLPPSFWPDALRNAAYVRNRVLCKGTSRTPFEVFFGRKPDVHRIRTFGALVYVHIPRDLRVKSANTSESGFLLGYLEDKMGCKVYFPQYHISRVVLDAHVHEDILYRDRRSVPPSVISGWPVDQHDDVEGIEDTEAEDSEASDSKAEDSDTADSDAVMESVGSSADEMGTDDEFASIAESVTPVRPRVFLRAPLANDPSQHEENAEPDKADSDSDPEGDEEDCVSAGEIADPGSESEVESAINRTGDSNSEESASVQSDAGEENDDEVRSVEETGQPEEQTADSDHSSELADPPPQDMDIETYGFDEEKEEELDRERALVDAMRSLNEVTLHREKRDRESKLPRRDNAKKQRYEPRETKRPKRDCKRPKYLEDYVVSSTLRPKLVGKKWRAQDVKMPQTFRQAMRSALADEWKEAMRKEMEALRDKGVLTWIEALPEGQHAITTKWVYDVKTDEMGHIIRFRARIVARGFNQIAGVDFTETFSPVARLSTYRMLLALSCLLGWQVWQGDVNNAYLNAKLKIKQYLKAIEGFPSEGGIYRVDQALYGLKQSGREWNEELDSWLKKRGFQPCKTEPCLYFYARDGVMAFVLVYVDDVLCSTNSEKFKSAMFEALASTYGFKDMGLLHSYLGIRVRQTKTEIVIDQEQYARQILERFGLTEERSNKCGIPMETTVKLKGCEHAKEGTCNHMAGKVPYREAVGSLMYLVTGTRPDLMFAVGQLSRFVEHPTEQHIGALKRVIHYLLRTTSKGIVFKKRECCDIGVHLQGHSDSDWANDVDTRKSTTGFVFTVMGGAVSWASRRQTIVAQSTAEAEYVAACEAAMEGKALMNILDELLPEMKRKITLGVDNKPSYMMATNPTFGRRTRHIELKWHYVRKQVAKAELYMLKVKSEDNPADLFTKPLARPRFELLSAVIGMRVTR